MTEQIQLETYLAGWDSTDPGKHAAADAIRAIADASADIAHRIACGSLLGDLSRTVGEEGGGDVQTHLDVWANERLIKTLSLAPVAAIASEELKTTLHLGEGPIGVAIDPLDGSSNIDTNVSLGTIFSIVPARSGDSAEAIFMQPGANQLAAGYIIYGPQTALVMTAGEGTQMFTLDPLARKFRLTAPRITIKQNPNEYAINASNYRHWSEYVRAYIDDCIAGKEGPRGADVNMRWIASLVAECHRILSRGGVFLYPADERKGYERGRLRLIYECNPIAFLVEQAGGWATDGKMRILDVIPTEIHQRTPLMFGSSEEMERIARYKANPAAIFERSPLFHQRGLLRV